MTKAVTPRTLSRKAASVEIDPVVPGLRWEIGKRLATARISPRVDGQQLNIRVLSVSKAAPLDEIGRQIKLAHQKAWQIKADADNGIKPAERERKEKRAAQQAQQLTFRNIFEEYMAVSGNAKVDAKERRRKVERYLYPAFDDGDRPIREITRADLKELLLERHAKAETQARRLRALVTRIWSYALKEDYVDANIALQIELPSEETVRDRRLARHEIAIFWHGLERAKCSPQSRLILRLLLVLGQRRSETALMHWDEIDVEKNRWEIPAAKTKSNRATRVPLTDQAWALIREAGTTSGYVFAGLDGRPPFLPSVTRAMRDNLPVLGLDNARATPHDLRRSFASGLGDLAIDRTVIIKLLNHAEPGITGKVYELADRWPQKVAAMEAWSAELTRIIISEPAPSNVEPLRAVQ
jgi:integrase